MNLLKELLNKRKAAIEKGRELLNKADKENREMNTEERVAYDAADSEVDKLSKRIAEEEKQIKREKEMLQAVEEGDESEGNRASGDKKTEVERRALQKYLRNGIGDLDADERRALVQTTTPDGGYLVPAQQMINVLIKKVDDLVFMRRRATIQRLEKAVSLGVPSLDVDPDDADWTSELGTGSVDSAMKFGKRELFPRPFAKRVKISNTLMRNSVIPVDTLVLERLAYKFGITEEKAYLTGSGANKPLGIYTASNDGIPTSRDVSTGNTTTAITFDGLIEAKYSVKSQYWPKASWNFHRTTVKMLRKIKDGEGRYIWEASVRAGEPDTVLNSPVDMSEYAPNTYTASSYVGVFGDMSNYWIAEALTMSVQRLIEVYAEANQTAFLGRREVDGQPVLSEAFARVQLAAS